MIISSRTNSISLWFVDGTNTVCCSKSSHTARAKVSKDVVTVTVKEIV